MNDSQHRNSYKQGTLDLLARYEQLSQASAQELAKTVGGILDEVLSYTTANLPWWQQFIGRNQVGASDLKSIPVLTKGALQENDRWLKVWIKGSTLKDYQTSQTSGSTGQPVSVLKYLPYYLPRHDAIRLLDALWQKRDLTAPVLSLNQSKSSGTFEKVGEPFSFLGPTGPVQVQNISKLPIERIVELIATSGARVVTMNAGLLKMVVDEQMKNPVAKFYIDEIVTFADPVDEDLRRKTSELFGAKITNRYTSEEFGYLALQCPYSDHLHALQFHNYIEILNENGEPCRLGEVGRVIVTSLTNPAMPLIRYEIGDLARWLPDCNFGITLPVLDPVITRVRDRLVTADGVSFIPTTGKAKFLAFPEIKDFQLFVFTDSLAILLAVRSELNEGQLAQISTDVQAIFRSNAPVHIQQFDSLAWLGTWKRRLFYQIPSVLPESCSIEDFQALAPGLEPGNNA
jgi:phenylacetate-CoA ligase